MSDYRQTESFQRYILDWYSTFKRDLPWRGERDPYRVLVSEVMLQQTGVNRVQEKYGALLQQFPTIKELAEASVADVLRAWRGLGYNRRALNLKRLAEIVVRDYGGTIPETVEGLLALPGIGRYTAHAVACFAYDAQVPVVDTNVRRVLSQWADKTLTETEAWALAEQLLPAGRAMDWNQALMDYGALVRKATRQRGENSEPFETSNRFWRGRIIDALRAAELLPLPQLLEALPWQGRDEGRVRQLVRALHEEGLVDYRVDQDTVRLPD